MTWSVILPEQFVPMRMRTETASVIIAMADTADAAAAALRRPAMAMGTASEGAITAAIIAAITGNMHVTGNRS